MQKVITGLLLLLVSTLAQANVKCPDAKVQMLYPTDSKTFIRSNSAELIQQVLVPAGITLRRSRAAPIRANEMFPNRRGGAEQFELLDRIPIKNFGPGSPLR